MLHSHTDVSLLPSSLKISKLFLKKKGAEIQTQICLLFPYVQERGRLEKHMTVPGL